MAVLQISGDETLARVAPKLNPDAGPILRPISPRAALAKADAEKLRGHSDEQNTKA